MANTYTLINSTSLSTTAASVTFSAIPATYDDLLLQISVRGTRTGVADLEVLLTVNSLTSNYSRTYLYGNGSSTASGRQSNQSSFVGDLGAPGTDATANTFGSSEWYLPKYASNASKPMSVFAVSENNGTLSFVDTTAGLNRNTDAITSITLAAGFLNFASGSTFWLYGIKNS